MCLAHGARASTADVDVVIADDVRVSVLEAAGRVAASLQLPSNWLSDGARRFVSRVPEGTIVLNTPTLVVRAAPPEQLLAMKLWAWRDEVDIDDARLLLSKLPGDMEQVWSLIGGFLEPAGRAQARYNFEDLWEATHEPS